MGRLIILFIMTIVASCSPSEFAARMEEKKAKEQSETVVTYASNPLVAKSFLKWGEEVEDEPRVGDVVVFPRGRRAWQGHVGFFVTSYLDEEGKLYYVILGGNQNNTVSYKVYEERKAISVRRWPSDMNTTVMTMN